MLKYSLWAFFWTLTLPRLSAQQNGRISWKERVGLAKSLQAEGNIADAAFQLELAGRQKPDRPELLFEAGKLYASARDYKKAAEAFRMVKNDAAHFPDAELRYAQALKQDEQYNEAIPEYLIYLQRYNGKDCDQVAEKIQEEVDGAAFGVRQSGLRKDGQTLERLDERINTSDNQFAPLPFSDDVLYFSATVNLKTRLYRSQWVSGAWTAAEISQSVVLPPQIQYDNGAFSSDLSRFYFTGCANEEKKGAEKLNCQLYLLKRQAAGWSAPLRLRDYINLPGALTTQPYVFNKGKKEILYFSSDRPGGYGGMDIWYAARDLGGGDLDFEEPKNAGGIVNTPGNEITPYYDVEEETLYFSSNGRATMGGLDIFKSKGSGMRWTPPENLGAPFNSGADDSYFIKNKNRTGGNLVSNRRFGKAKTTSRDDDIFGFSTFAPQNFVARGAVFDTDYKTPLTGVVLSLYEIKGKNNLRLLSAIQSADGAYQFALLSDKKYRIEAEKDGYQTGSLEFAAEDAALKSPKWLFLEKSAQFVSNHTLISTEAPLESKATEFAIAPMNTTFPPAAQKKAPPEKSPMYKPIYKTIYKIQLVAYKILDITYQRKLQLVKEFGRFDEEVIEGKAMKRVLLGDFSDYDDARGVLKKVKEISFKDAFLVKYENGERVR